MNTIRCLTSNSLSSTPTNNVRIIKTPKPLFSTMLSSFNNRHNPKLTTRTLTVFTENIINSEKINLEIHTILNDKDGIMRAKHRIADAKILSLILSGDLPS